MKSQTLETSRIFAVNRWCPNFYYFFKVEIFVKTLSKFWKRFDSFPWEHPRRTFMGPTAWKNNNSHLYLRLSVHHSIIPPSLQTDAMAFQGGFLFPDLLWHSDLKEWFSKTVSRYLEKSAFRFVRSMDALTLVLKFELIKCFDRPKSDNFAADWKLDLCNFFPVEI